MSSRQQSPVTSYVILTLGALCVSFAPVFVKMLGYGVIGLTAIGFWRTLFGGLLLMAIVALRRKPLLLPGRLMGWAALAGFLFFLDLAIWHRSIMYAGAGLSTILANTQVFNTAVLSFLLLGERPSARFFIAAVAALGGVALLVGIGSDVAFSDQYILGIVFGLITGLVYASYLVTLKRSGQGTIRPDFMTFIAWTSLFAAGFLAFAAPFEHGVFMPPDIEAWGILAALGVVVQALGWWAIYSSLSKLAVSRTGLILLLQPALATVWGALFFDELLTVIQVVGALVTLVAIYYGSVYRTSQEPIEKGDS